MKILSSDNFGNRKRDKRKMPRFLEKKQSIMKLFKLTVLLTKMNQLKERKTMILSNAWRKGIYLFIILPASVFTYTVLKSGIELIGIQTRK